MSSYILIVEDEANILESLSYLLRREGFEVSAAEDGADVMNLINTRKPDLLILDVIVPGTDGFQILRDIRAAPATADLPVIMLTARVQQKDRQLAEDIGASAFMTKPFANAEIVSTVKRLIP